MERKLIFYCVFFAVCGEVSLTKEPYEISRLVIAVTPTEMMMMNSKEAKRPMKMPVILSSVYDIHIIQLVKGVGGKKVGEKKKGGKNMNRTYRDSKTDISQKHHRG